MDRTGFSLLAMGFTGARALTFKLRYIEQYDAMEVELKRRATDPMAVLEDPAKMRHLLLTYSEKVIALQHDLDEAKPVVAAYERIATASDGTLCITDSAKALQMRPKDLFTWLSSHHWIYRRAGTMHWIGYQDKIQAGYLEHKVTEVTRGDGSIKITEQVLVTAKGVARLAKMMGQSQAA